MKGRSEGSVNVCICVSMCVNVEGWCKTDIETDTVTITAYGIGLTVYGLRLTAYG